METDMFFDPLYIVLVMPAVIFAMWASHRVNSTFKKYSAMMTRSGMTGYDAARRVLDENGLSAVKIERVEGNLTDHYDPRNNIIRLSDSVYNSRSAAAVGVAAHEAGHAIQYAQHYAPIKIRNAIIPVTRIGSTLAFPLVLIGLLLSQSSQSYIAIAYAGLILFAAVAFFQLVTLPTEYNASSRAIAAIEGAGILTTEEVDGAKRVLSAAALTYVAALAVSLMQLLRLFLRVRDRR
ncbi:MAG: zinc metallopeptidase [Eubacteriales bacterium]|nr:zinc metallopeptidase [Eubacteriales bacterium]MDD4474788.1 zinc metallopeptidase [Eubacteriales bacterium]